VFWTVLTLAFATLIQAGGLATWNDALSFSATNWLPWVAIAPVVFWLARRFPFEKGKFLRSVPVHVVACAGCVVCAIWLSAQFAPVRRPPTTTRPPGATEPAPRDNRERTATERRPVEPGAPGAAGIAGIAGTTGAPDAVATAGPAIVPEAGDRPLVEIPPDRTGATSGTATERRTVRTERTDWPAGERPPGNRRNWERNERGGPGGTLRGAPPAPQGTVPSLLRRWAVLGWTPFSSTVLRVNFSAAVYVLIACVAHAMGYYRRAQERESQALALTDGLNRAKLDALRLQLQPHFLFNTLNAISALVHRNPAAADELITDLSELLRLSLKSADHEVPLSRELELLECYLAIEQTRLGDRLRIVRDFDAGAASALVPTLILQPLAENAIRHGIEPRREPGTLTISVRRVGLRLRLVVADDGMGLKGPGASSARHGIGLANAEQRLRVLHGENAQLELTTPKDGGVRVEIWLPIRSTPAQAAAPA
jgi:two-component sensor histidine kinase